MSGPHTEGGPVPPAALGWPATPPGRPVAVDLPPETVQAVTFAAGEWVIVRLPMATSDARFEAVLEAFRSGPAAGRVYVVATDAPIIRP